MAKKFVRGVTGIEDIESYDKTLTNVNDILSDGQDTYVHTKKGKTESYYKLTDGLKSITSDNSDLITVTKDDTTNTATLHPKHDNAKEQTLESTRGTVTIQHAENGSSATTKVDTNPQKVLEHENLLTDYGISKTTSGNTTKLSFEYKQTTEGFDLNNLQNGNVRTWKAVNAPRPNYWFYVSSFKASSSQVIFQEATTIDDGVYKNYKRYFDGTNWTQWREQVGDKSVIDGLLAQKQNKLTAGDGISFIGDTISLKVLDQYNGNLNDLVYTCLAKPVDNVPNLPTGVAGNGILTVVRVGNVVSQKYHPFLGNKLYIRTCRDLPNTPKWSEWTLLTQA